MTEDIDKGIIGGSAESEVADAAADIEDFERVVDLFHEEDGMDFRRRDVRAILQPCGLYYNRELMELRKGDKLRFFGNKEGVVVDVTEVDMSQPLFGTLVRWIYGEEFCCANVIDRWLEHAVIQGNGRSAVSLRKCLLIRYKVEKL